MEGLPGIPKKEIRDISVKKADNGGYVLRYCIYTPSGLNSESSWDDRTLAYDEDKKEQMIKDLSTLLDETLN